MFRTFLAVAFVLILAITAWWLASRGGERRQAGPAPLRGAGGTITIAATGDALPPTRWPQPDRDAGFGGVVRLLSGASLAITNLEQNLLDASDVATGEQPPRWPHGSRATAEHLRDIGVSVVSCANNHALDYGRDGMARTLTLLDAAGIHAAGCGDDLVRARRPAVVGTPPRAVAVIAVTTSAAADSRAKPPSGDLIGWPGVSALRYAADVTADPATYATLKQAMAQLPGGTAADGTDLIVGGTTIRKGAETRVELIADASDEADLLSGIRAARANGAMVVVSIHSHEPSNASDRPAEFVRRFARKAVESGAALVIGHGPHRLRGIEIYGGGAILYSLGNFMYDDAAVDSRAMDVYEAGADLYGIVLGTGTANTVPASDRGAVRWQSVVAVATFRDNVLEALRLQPIDLGVDARREQRGVPWIASADRAASILERIAALSAPFGTHIRVEQGAAVVDIRGVPR